MTQYRFRDGLGDVMAEGEFPDHAAAIAAIPELEEGVGNGEVEIQRVEFLGPQGDWRWAGPLGG